MNEKLPINVDTLVSVDAMIKQSQQVQNMNQNRMISRVSADKISARSATAT